MLGKTTIIATGGVDLGDLHEVVIDQQCQHFADIREFGLGEGARNPVVEPGVVEDIAQDFQFLPELFAPQAAPDPGAALQPAGHDSRHFDVRVDVVGQ
jgi:hypothetical protein